MRIRYSKGGDLEIEGTRDELQAVRQQILDIVEAGTGSVDIPCATTGSPAPYERWLERFVVMAGSGPVCMVVNESYELHACGDRESLVGLASFFDAPADAETGWHSHYEHYAGNRWVAAESVPTVISLRRPTSA